MRGKEHKQEALMLSEGITPAYAGKSYPAGAGVGISQDHPRVCGEKLPCVLFLVSASGSPPRMRGKAKKVDAQNLHQGNTPAYAGKSGLSSKNILQVKDHPRVCGEKISSARSLMLRAGSPPRMRGKEYELQTLPRWQRITPAYAGKRLKRSHRIGHFSCILCLFHSVLHRASASGGSRAGPCAPPCLPAQNAVPV